VTQERDASVADSQLLQSRIHHTHKLLKLAAEQQLEWQVEQDQLLTQLESENRQLRSLLLIDCGVEIEETVGETLARLEREEQ
jgi:hypothetical protein